MIIDWTTNQALVGSIVIVTVHVHDTTPTTTFNNVVDVPRILADGGLIRFKIRIQSNQTDDWSSNTDLNLTANVQIL